MTYRTFQTPNTEKVKTEMQQITEAEKAFTATQLAVQHLQETIHAANVEVGWWTDKETGESTRGKRNVGESLCLIHSEISEAMEAHRKGLNDDKLPHRSGFEVELADAIIRICDLAGGYDLDLAGAVAEKIEYNRTRPDHKIENRLKDGGKAY